MLVYNKHLLISMHNMNIIIIADRHSVAYSKSGKSSRLDITQCVKNGSCCRYHYYYYYY